MNRKQFVAVLLILSISMAACGNSSDHSDNLPDEDKTVAIEMEDKFSIEDKRVSENIKNDGDEDPKNSKETAKTYAEKALEERQIFLSYTDVSMEDICHLDIGCAVRHGDSFEAVLLDKDTYSIWHKDTISFPKVSKSADDQLIIFHEELNDCHCTKQGDMIYVLPYAVSYDSDIDSDHWKIKQLTEHNGKDIQEMKAYEVMNINSLDSTQFIASADFDNVEGATLSTDFEENAAIDTEHLKGRMGYYPQFLIDINGASIKEIYREGNARICGNESEEVTFGYYKNGQYKELTGTCDFITFISDTNAESSSITYNRENGYFILDTSSLQNGYYQFVTDTNYGTEIFYVEIID